MESPLTDIVPAEGDRVAVAGGALAVRRLGHTRPLAVAIHGITASSQTWSRSAGPSRGG
ncbi:MAG: hypothetical protein M3022_16400 [Actinomycetota bacterium]|nr:hypothetical protein [Actinomycetota bacterium]